jgi:peptidyl-prolyl cis-trans isomerase-like 4
LESTRQFCSDLTDDRAAGEFESVSRFREAQSNALALEMMGDLPFAEIKPPENVLFVCKLNEVTRDEDLELIFGRFGKISSCEVIRDKITKASLCYAFIEYDDRKSCETAYFKMDNVLIDDRRIKVDFSQSVSKLHGNWVQDRRSKILERGGGYGGFANLSKRTQYRNGKLGNEINGGYNMIFQHDVDLKEGCEFKAPEHETEEADPIYRVGDVAHSQVPVKMQQGKNKCINSRYSDQTLRGLHNRKRKSSSSDGEFREDIFERRLRDRPQKGTGAHSKAK